MIDLEKFADRVGIGRDYVDAAGRYTVISHDARMATLGAMGYDIENSEALEQRALLEEITPFKEILDPVTVIREGERLFIMMRTPEVLSEAAYVKWYLTLEDGKQCQGSVPLEEVEIADYEEVQGRVYDTRRFILPNELPREFGFLPLGYHKFKVEIVDGTTTLKSIEQSLIMTPLRCYIPNEMIKGNKYWGASVQLYAVRSRQNWGVGDFHDLKLVLKEVHSRGGQFVGLNPMHAGYPGNPDPDMVSPYSPSSRRWLNIIYIAVNDVPEFINNKEANQLVNSPAFAKKLQALRDREYVDYRAVLELKLKVLEMIFDLNRMTDKRTSRGKKFLEFIQNGGESLLNMATYDAMQRVFYEKGINAWGWKKFPREYQDCNSAFVSDWREKNKQLVYFYCYLQFIAEEQLAEAYAGAKADGMVLGTYRDLAVGVSEGSCDVWADTDRIYRGQAEVGAPPDPLGPLGQSWGLAPMDPHALRRSQYKTLIELYRANMRHCGALRIDHAAGLYRFWWVPPKHSAVDGAYVYNNLHDWLGILALESQRHKCLIIAEDLGTIPMELRVALKEVGAYSYKLFFGERAADGGYIAPQDYEPHALSALTTHDTATLIGWWSNYDLTLGQDLGIYTEQQVIDIGRERDECKQRILDSLHGLGSVGPDVPRTYKELPEMTKELAIGLERHMCRGSCALFSSQLEDWIGVVKPVNVPGTMREYPNWRRKLTMNIEDFEKDAQVKEMTAAMTAARIDASPKPQIHQALASTNKTSYILFTKTASLKQASCFFMSFAKIIARQSAPWWVLLVQYGSISFYFCKDFLQICVHLLSAFRANKCKFGERLGNFSTK